MNGPEPGRSAASAEGEPRETTAPAEDARPRDGAAPAASEAEPGAAAPRRRTHPLTPLITGWKIVLGVVAVLTAQNIAQLLEEFTLHRALLGLGVLAAAVVLSVLVSAALWWATTYAVDEAGVSLHTGLISRSREYAPRARIESVSVERPLMARLLGLAKVRIEVAGGGDSYLDLQYLRADAAEELRRGILDIAATTTRPGPGAAAAPHGAAGQGPMVREPGSLGADVAGTSGAASSSGAAEVPAHGTALRGILRDGVVDGEPIAEIPTSRLLRSLLRDLGFLGGLLASLLGVLVAIGLSLWQDGLSVGVIVALLPAAVAVPKYVLGRIEAGWGFVSRMTPRGLRMRRGLLNTRTDNIAAGRIQQISLHRPWLWRGPGWTAATVTVAGIGDEDDNGAENVLPVGTAEELRATLAHLAAPLGTDDDLATVERLLTARARDLDGLRTPVRAFWIDRRTSVTVLLPGALVQRRGLLGRSLEIIPRERIQELRLEEGPLTRRLGVLDLDVGVADHTLHLMNLPRGDVLALHAQLARDARTLRRYRDRGPAGVGVRRVAGTRTPVDVAPPSQDRGADLPLGAEAAR